MADYDLTLSRAAIPDLLEQPAALGKLVETILNQVLEAQIRASILASIGTSVTKNGRATAMDIVSVSSQRASDRSRFACLKRATAVFRPIFSSVIVAANKLSCLV
jgi:hypothetical protein